jgi:hypothetical protein
MRLREFRLFTQPRCEQSHCDDTPSILMSRQSHSIASPLERVAEREIA